MFANLNVALQPNTRPTRFCGLIDKSPLKLNREGGHYVAFSFRKSVGDIFEQMTGIHLTDRESQYGSFIAANLNAEQKVKVEEWLRYTRGLVFLDSELDCSVALGMNSTGVGQRTIIGEHESRAKERGCPKSHDTLVSYAKAWIDRLPCYCESFDFIAAVPRTTGKPISFPEKITDDLSRIYKKPSLVGHMHWENKTQSLQGASSKGEKIRILEASGLKVFPPPNFVGSTVLLIDDLYQSGITMEFVARALKSAGAKKVIGLAMVKSLRNDANVVRQK